MKRPPGTSSGWSELTAELEAYGRRCLRLAKIILRTSSRTGVAVEMEELAVQYLSEGPRYGHFVSLSSLTLPPNTKKWLWGQPTPSILVTDTWCRIVTVLEENHGPFRRQAAQASRVDIREAVRKLWHFRKHTLELDQL